MKPYYTHPYLDLYVGHVLDVLAALPADSLDCCVTSPPYLGLRSYGTEPQVWLDGQAACEEHEWGESIQAGESYADGSRTRWQHVGGREGMPSEGFQEQTRQGAFCRRCNAWRGELGLEPTPDLFVAHLVEVFRAVKRVLKPTGVCFVNLGDSYNGSGGAGGDYAPGGLKDGQPKYPGRHVSGLKAKDLMMMPARVALALQANGWWLRSEIVWAKPNPMPESVTDRPTRSHEMIYLLTKSARYYYDAEAVREPHLEPWRGQGQPEVYGEYQAHDNDLERGRHQLSRNGVQVRLYNPAGRNCRSVWEFATHPYPEAHFATFPPELPRRCIAAGSSEHGVCPACGKPWTRVVEKSLTPHDGETASLYQSGSNGNRLSLLRQSARERGGEYLNEVKTLGWEPTCTCARPDVAPAVVLDPFGGSGTTGLVANQMGRRAILIELKQEYADMAIKRLQQEVLL